MATLEFHPAAEQFPLLDSQRLDELAEDIQQYGQREPIRTFKGQIVDGRNRYLACRKVGIEPSIKPLDESLDPFAYVWSLNGQRRDLTQDQRYLIWKVCASKSGEWDKMHRQVHSQANQSRSEILSDTTHDDRPSTMCGRSMEKPRGQGSALRAIASKTNRGTVERMDRLQRLRPDLAEKVRLGRTTSADALRQITTDNTKPHIIQNTGDNEWYTPQDYVELARKVMGSIDLDPASCEQANRIVKAKTFFSQDDDGLAQPWTGCVWMNPPYAQPYIQRFIDKLVGHIENKDVDQAVVLVNNATETRWGQLLLRHASAVCFPSGRIRFWHPDKVSAPLQGQMIVYFGCQVEAFSKAFSNVGAICHGG